MKIWLVEPWLLIVSRCSTSISSRCTSYRHIGKQGAIIVRVLEMRSLHECFSTCNSRHHDKMTTIPNLLSRSSDTLLRLIRHCKRECERSPPFSLGLSDPPFRVPPHSRQEHHGIINSISVRPAVHTRHGTNERRIGRPDRASEHTLGGPSWREPLVVAPQTRPRSRHSRMQRKDGSEPHVTVSPCATAVRRKTRKWGRAHVQGGTADGNVSDDAPPTHGTGRSSPSGCLGRAALEGAKLR